MPPHSRQQLAVRRARRQLAQRRRNRRLALATAVPAAVAILAALALVLAGGDPATSGPAPVAAPSAAALSPSQLPTPVALAGAGALSLTLPVARTHITAVAFRAVDTPGVIALTPATGNGIPDMHVAPNDGSGADTGSVDVGAPAGTSVYSPVDGTVLTVTPYVIFGRTKGYEVVIAPRQAGDAVVRMNHLDPPIDSPTPDVGAAVRAGVTQVGRVSDFSDVARQELARYTADSGNHVHIEVVRVSPELVR